MFAIVVRFSDGLLVIVVVQPGMMALVSLSGQAMYLAGHHWQQPQVEVVVVEVVLVNVTEVVLV